VRRRIYLVGTVIATASLVIGAGIATAASSTKTVKVKPIVLKCNISMATEAAAGSSSVDPTATQGNQYGPTHCPTKGFGAGMIADSFTVPDSGDTVGTYVEYFKAGSVTGAFDLTPNESPPLTDTTFSSQSWTGTITVMDGTGVYKGIKTYKAKHKPATPGVLNCTSPDSVHLTCTEKIKVTMPPATIG
jgi:hypothetical protein